MSELSQHGTSTTAPARGAGYIFGLPIGDLGWFATLLTVATLGFATFFAGTFFGITGIMIYSSITHRAIDYAISYRSIGLPIGVVVTAVSGLYLGTLWVRRMLRRS